MSVIPQLAKKKVGAGRNVFPASPFVDQETLRHLAVFRYRLRKFLRFSEQAARKCGVTPQQHQLLLGIAGHMSSRKGTISELADFLQERHNSVVELVARAAERRLVRKVEDKHDRRRVLVAMTPKGEAVLSQLSALHKEEIRQLQTGLPKFLNASTTSKKQDRRPATIGSLRKIRKPKSQATKISKNELRKNER
jgi:DNA-binding MarR family transcriptional regulator